MKENIQAMEFGLLSEEQMKKISEIYGRVATYNTHGHTPALAGGARELRFPSFEKAQFVTECGITG